MVEVIDRPPIEGTARVGHVLHAIVAMKKLSGAMETAFVYD